MDFPPPNNNMTNYLHAIIHRHYTSARGMMIYMLYYSLDSVALYFVCNGLGSPTTPNPPKI